MRVEQIEANHCPFFSIAPGVLSRVKKEQEKAFGGDSSVVSLKTPQKITVRLPGLWALVS